jgi:uncharacterized protein YdeI (YjbR/CyaY-like superfamily)
VERLQRLNNARAVADRSLANADAAFGSGQTNTRSAAPENVRAFQLPDELQGVDPALIATYDTLNNAANILARSSGSPDLRAGIARDLDIIGNDILAALAASKEFNSANGRGGRGGPLPGSAETLSAALNRITNGLDYSISSTNAANVDRLQHLNNARVLAGRALAAAAAAGSAQSRPGAAQEPQRQFQLPDDLQGVDPRLIGTYNTLNSAVAALARSGVGPEGRAEIVRDLDTIGNEILAALTATREFSGRGGRAGRGGAPAAQTPNLQ